MHLIFIFEYLRKSTTFEEEYKVYLFFLFLSFTIELSLSSYYSERFLFKIYIRIRKKIFKEFTKIKEKYSLHLIAVVRTHFK